MEDGLEATTSMSSAEAETAVRAEDVDGSVVEKESDPTGLVGSNNMTTFLRRWVLSNRTLLR